MTTRERRRTGRPAGPPAAPAPLAAPSPPAVTTDPRHAAGCPQLPPVAVSWANPQGRYLPLWRCTSCGASWPREAGP